MQKPTLNTPIINICKSLYKEKIKSNIDKSIQRVEAFSAVITALSPRVRTIKLYTPGVRDFSPFTSGDSVLLGRIVSGCSLDRHFQPKYWRVAAPQLLREKPSKYVN